MRTTLLALIVTALGACGGPLVVPGGDGETCEVVDVASFSGCTTQPIPIRNHVSSTDDLVVYVDGVALDPEQWTTDGNTITIDCLDPSPGGWHLVSVSLGCVAIH
jgi:hypothetical protein